MLMDGRKENGIPVSHHAWGRRDKNTKGNNSTKIADGVLVLILCIPSDVASYFFKDYESFFDSSKF